ncbi:MAG: hypothetical protein RIR31_3 [Bacteroidota bacterium]|jgi:DNA-binding NtrC family response regulator
MKIQKDSPIFIIDDDPFWTALLTQILASMGYVKISTYNNGTDGLSNLTLNPALIFLDYQMEDVNGLEVLQKIKEYNAKIRVIFCTAHQDLSVAINAMAFGSFDYLLKENATKKEVASIVSNLVNK